MLVRPPGHCSVTELEPIETVRRAWLWLESVEDQVSADVSRVVQTSKSNLMVRGIAFDLLQIPSELARSAKPPNTKICPGRKVSPWTALLKVEGSIEPCSDDREELSMKAPMSVSKPADLG